ncbi:MAG: glycine cleavage system protein GcvH [Xanthomonadales bacterium]|nr:glycine cleavage system protein GcvH [Xanthomonadales bacterium]
MSEIPGDLYYTASHEWVRIGEDGAVHVGITDHAQQALGELVYVELPEEGEHYDAGAACAVVESVKAASDIYCPVSGKVEEANTALSDSPELINNSPYEDGWIMTMTPDSMDDVRALMPASDYENTLEDD